MTAMQLTVMIISVCYFVFLVNAVKSVLKEQRDYHQKQLDYYDQMLKKMR